MKQLPILLALALVPLAQAQFRPSQRPPVRPDAVQPDVPGTEAGSDFPLRLHIPVVKWGGLSYRNHGYGYGNLEVATGLQGFDYAFECDVPFVENHTPDKVYRARWKRAPYQLEILTAEVGGKHTHTCTLSLAPEPEPFTSSNSARFTHGVSSSMRVPWQNPDFTYWQSAPDYPVRFHVLDAQRNEDNIGDHGWGTANLLEPAPGAKPEGADFHYGCDHGFLPNSQLTGSYQGHWIKAGEKLEILLQRAGSEKFDKCMVTVALRPDPYPQRGVRAQSAGAPSASPDAP